MKVESDLNYEISNIEDIDDGIEQLEEYLKQLLETSPIDYDETNIVKKKIEMIEKRIKEMKYKRKVTKSNIKSIQIKLDDLYLPMKVNNIQYLHRI